MTLSFKQDLDKQLAICDLSFKQDLDKQLAICDLSFKQDLDKQLAIKINKRRLHVSHCAN